MRLRWFGCLFTILLAFPATLLAQADSPALVLRFSSIDALMQNAKLFTKITGEEGAWRQIEGALRSKIGAKGLEGIDTTRPVGAYVRFGKEIDEVSAALLLPVIDEKSFLSLLEKLNINATKGKNDIYTVQTGQPFDVYFRFKNQYAYVSSPTPESLNDKNLLDPTKVLAGKGGMAALQINLDRLPDGAKTIALGQIEQKLQEAGEKGPPSESPEQKAVRIALLKEFTKVITGIIKDGSDMRVNLDIDASAQNLSASFSLAGKPGTELARSLESLGLSKSLFTNLTTKQNIGFVSGLDVTLPKDLASAFLKLIQDGTEKAIASMQDEGKRGAADSLYRAILPSLESGRLDASYALQGTAPGAFTHIVGVRLQQGEKLNKTIRDLLEAILPHIPEAEKAKIHLDVDSVGSVKIHRFEIPSNDPGMQKLQKLVGNTDLHLAIRDDALFLAMGQSALPTLKSALGNSSAGTSPLVLMHLDLGRLAPILAQTPAQKEIAAKVLTPGQDHSVRLTATGGNNLTIRLDIKLSALEFFAKSGKASK